MILLYISTKGEHSYFIADSNTGDCTLFQSHISDSVISYYKKAFRSRKLNDLRIQRNYSSTELLCIDISRIITSDPIETENLVFSKYPELLL